LLELEQHVGPGRPTTTTTTTTTHDPREEREERRVIGDESSIGDRR
jgi:hypothetical protein